MKLIKYDKTRDASGKSIIVGSSGGNGSSNTSRGEEVVSSTLDRTIWGKHDDGDDIDGSMIVNGNVTIKSIIPPIYEPDDDEDGEDEDYETGGGNLDVELGVTAKDVYGHSLYLDYPKLNDTKTNVLDLFKDHDTRILDNKNEISEIIKRIDELEFENSLDWGEY